MITGSLVRSKAADLTVMRRKNLFPPKLVPLGIGIMVGGLHTFDIRPAGEASLVKFVISLTSCLEKYLTTANGKL